VASHRKSKKFPGTETQQLRPIPGPGQYVPMESQRSYVLRMLAGLAAFAVVIALVIVLCLLVLR
jgi:hypothetical protein